MRIFVEPSLINGIQSREYRLVGRNQKPSSSILRDNATGGVQFSALLCIGPMANIRTCQINAQVKQNKEKTGKKGGKAKTEDW